MSTKEIKAYLDQFTLEELVKDQHHIMERAREMFPEATDFEMAVAFVTWLNENRDDEGHTTIEYKLEKTNEQ